MESKSIKCCIELVNMIDTFIEEYEKVNGIRIKRTQATKLLYIKIKNIGGLKVT